MRNTLMLLFALLISTVGMAQKDEIKAAEKSLKDGRSAEAVAALEGASGTIASADPKMQAQYYVVMGKAKADLGKKGDTEAFAGAVEALKKVVEIEEASGKAKYSGEAQQVMQSLSAELVNAAVADNGNNNFEAAAEKLYTAYSINPADTIYLYYAASSAVQGGTYERALDFYKELKEIGYDGSSVVYKAVNVETGEAEEMSKQQRDLMVKSGTYTNPTEEKQPSKKSEIVKNIALIYNQLGKNDEALAAYAEARADNPDDVNLVLNQANLYYQMGDKDKFKELMTEAAQMEPDNADLHYNIGVINMEQGNMEEARASFKKAIEINPGYTNAQLNLSTTYVNEGNSLIDAMNELGTSRDDIAKYDELKAKKDALFQEGATILEEALKNNPENQGILTQLKNIYGALGDNENFMRMKKLLGE
ncbi:Flp pilus assembly protein TadD, contains TPR repeats [Robiginitalea myxolifaciens]|uniref:Flp pilus assembly protein TadD, contains TPR repeats n=1 Tax=Robiginitalea myxolifaciens TaxID=400055 RepID=A0A1I6H389_9FLAO|nr:tetratricopeptide repeat protein [Robiginitalea myxolifaciens]SFR48882.1 Flp pilus assembly protein TadD, contains TPR repeats [Robiginitalea myxolifaciens]